MIRWDTYPPTLRHACKLYIFALLNVVDHAPRLAYAATEIPSIKTICERPLILLTCVWQPETAACQDHNATSEHAGPTWPRCGLTCSNIAYTDRDITELRRHANRLQTNLAAPGLHQPLRQRITDRIAEYHRAIATHHSNANTATTRKGNLA